MDFKRSIQDCCKRERISQEMFCQRLGCTMSELRYAGNWSRIAHGAWVAFGAKLEGYEPRSAREERAWAEQLLPWIRRFPVKALQKRGLLPHGTCGAGSVRDVLRFMGVGGREGFDKTYAFTLDSVAPQVYAAWIRIGETLASADAAKSKSTFAVDKDLLARNLKTLTRNSGVGLRSAIAKALRDSGIGYIEVEPFIAAPYPTCASFWIGDAPFIQASTSRINDSVLLESICRTAWHIAAHPRRRSSFLVAPCNAPASPTQNTQDAEAQKFAGDLLLPEADECRLICCGRFEEDRCIRYFSRTLRVRPGILVERLQQQGKLPHRTLLNDFKVAV